MYCSNGFGFGVVAGGLSWWQVLVLVVTMACMLVGTSCAVIGTVYAVRTHGHVR
jgi:hypothetical protein